MNAPLEIDSEIGRAVRAELIRARVLLPSEAHEPRHFAPSVRLDSGAFDAVAIEIIATSGAPTAHEIAAALPPGSAVRAALLLLLSLSASRN